MVTSMTEYMYQLQRGYNTNTLQLYICICYEFLCTQVTSTYISVLERQYPLLNIMLHNTMVYIYDKIYIIYINV